MLDNPSANPRRRTFSPEHTINANTIRHLMAHHQWGAIQRILEAAHHCDSHIDITRGAIKALASGIDEVCDDIRDLERKKKDLHRSMGRRAFIGGAFGAGLGLLAGVEAEKIYTGPYGPPPESRTIAPETLRNFFGAIIGCIGATLALMTPDVSHSRKDGLNIASRDLGAERIQLARQIKELRKFARENGLDEKSWAPKDTDNAAESFRFLNALAATATDDLQATGTDNMVSDAAARGGTMAKTYLRRFRNEVGEACERFGGYVPDHLSRAEPENPRGKPAPADWQARTTGKDREWPGIVPGAGF